jgi:hypothetical protein
MSVGKSELAIFSLLLAGGWHTAECAESPVPLYPDAAYGGETVKLENSAMRLQVFKRVSGWGWVEVFDRSGQLMAVLDHFGEVDPVVSGRTLPVRIEAQRYQFETGGFGQRLTFPVQLVWYQSVAKSPWAVTELAKPALEGTVTITLAAQAGAATLNYDLKPLRPLGVRYLRGPWLKVGSGSFGASKTDGIFPGVEWLWGEEWSSGTDWFQHPEALRVAPHPFKVAAPVMALSRNGTGIGLAWNPNAGVMGEKRYPQPIYASPNFVDRANNHLMGLALPSVAWGVEENTLPLHSTKPGPAAMELLPESPIRFEAEISLVKGNSLDVVVDWVKRHGLPEPPKPRYELSAAMERLARAYNSVLWHEGKGWGKTADQASPHPPLFLERYASMAPGLKAKIEWGRQQLSSGKIRGTGRSGLRAMSMWPREAQYSHGRGLLGQQRGDGSFGFDPEGRHKRDMFYMYPDSIYKPLGIKGDTALDLNVQPAGELLILAGLTGEGEFRSAARKALDYCLPLQRPEGGDWWETPLHSPNLLAAGHAATAYYLGYKAFNDPRYLERAVYWLRALLPFTHLWQPQELTEMYNTKPCFNSTLWYLSTWVTNHVQWEVLVSLAQSSDVGIDWAKVDPEIDWNRYQRGVTTAALRWMVDHEDTAHRAKPPAKEADMAKQGLLDGYFYDVHDSVVGDYKGALIEPYSIGVNLAEILGRE